MDIFRKTRETDRLITVANEFKPDIVQVVDQRLGTNTVIEVLHRPYLTTVHHVASPSLLSFAVDALSRVAWLS